MLEGWGGLFVEWPCSVHYHQTSNISRTLVGNEIVDHSDVVGAPPIGAALTTSEWSTLLEVWRYVTCIKVYAFVLTDLTLTCMIVARYGKISGIAKVWKFRMLHNWGAWYIDPYQPAILWNQICDCVNIWSIWIIITVLHFVMWMSWMDIKFGMYHQDNSDTNGICYPTSTVQLLKFANVWMISSHTL